MSWRGLEPLTSWAETRRSIQLSYQDKRPSCIVGHKTSFVKGGLMGCCVLRVVHCVQWNGWDGSVRCVRTLFGKHF